MTAHLASIAVDAVIWLFITWAAVICWCSRKAAVDRRRRPVKVVRRPVSPDAVQPATVKVLPQQRKAS